MYKVKRRSPGEEMSSCLRIPKTGWVTSLSTKRLSWTINDLEGYKKNSVYIGVKYSLLGGKFLNFKEPLEIKVLEEEGQEEERMNASVVGPEEALEKELEQDERSRLYAAFMMGLMLTHKVKGMTAEDLPTVLQRR